MLVGMVISVAKQEYPLTENYIQPIERQPNKTIRSVTSPQELLKLTDAEKIMGEAVHLADSSTKNEQGIVSYRCGYKANAVTGDRPGAVYFLFQHYDQVANARQRFTSTKTSNESLGVETLTGLGDEAYFHTDKEHFYFIMVRKDNRVFNLKVNKLSNTTSLDEFKQIAKRIAMDI